MPTACRHVPLMGLAAVLLAAPASPEPASPIVPVVEAAPIDVASAIRLDGELTEEVWNRAPTVSGFLQREPREGLPATLDTEVRIAYDQSHLYVAVRALDNEPERIVGLLTRRDVESPSDSIHVFIDSYRDRRTAFEFAVNAAGVKMDRYWFNDTRDDRGWDAVWDVAVARDDRGWKAEFRIPFSQLRYAAATDARFGFAVARSVARLNEVSTWPLLPRSGNGFVSAFGDLAGLSVHASQRRLELLPYAKGDLVTSPDDPGDPFVKSHDPGGAMGLDLKYALSPGLTLTGTVNPDFGQVEADPAVVNLSAFETFFPERRPFFLEGSGIFRFDIDCEDDQCTGLFYSRRIGRSPQVSPDVPDDGYSDAPSYTSILGAGKVTGRVGRFSVGVLNAVTAEESARAAGPDGEPLATQVVEPLANYAVVRARREFANQSSLGFMTTATNRRLPESVTSLASAAYSGGVDADWRVAPRYRLRGFFAGSLVRGDAEAIEALQTDNRHLFQRPDAGHVTLDPTRHSLAGHAGELGFDKIGGERVRFSSSGGYKSPGFEINDLGFMRRADEVSWSNWVQVRHERPWKALRSARVNFNQWQAWNFDGDRLFMGGNVNGHVSLTSNWHFGIGVNVNGGGFDDRATRGGPGARTNSRTGGWSYVETDDRRVVGLNLFGFTMRDRHDSSVYQLSPSVRVRPTSALTLRLGFRWSHNLDDDQWIENVETDAGDRYVFGRLDQTTAAVTLRAEYTITPTLSLQLYGEPFVSSGRYTGFKELVDGRAPAYDDRYRPYAYEANPDFRYTSFRTTNVLRWEYRPGSTLFVVWQQGRDEYDEGAPAFSFGRDLGHVFGVPANNVFLVKLSYWINR